MVKDNHYHPYNMFSNFGKVIDPEIPGKNYANFMMNSVCTGILFDSLIYHMVSEDKGYTFE
jgi:hypothetical protein